MSRLPKLLSAATLALGLIAGGVGTAFAGPQSTVDRSLQTFRTFIGDRDLEPMRELLRSAKGVFIVPAYVKGSVLVGGARGEGVLLARLPQGGWSNPVFLSITQASLGVQVGATSSQLLFVVMTDRGLNTMLSKDIEIGAEVAAAAGPGGGYGAASGNADLYTYAKVKGGFAGVSFSGGKVSQSGTNNRNYYDSPAADGTSIAAGQFTNVGATALVQTVGQF